MMIPEEDRKMKVNHEIPKPDEFELPKLGERPDLRSSMKEEEILALHYDKVLKY